MVSGKMQWDAIVSVAPGKHGKYQLHFDAPFHDPKSQNALMSNCTSIPDFFSQTHRYGDDSLTLSAASNTASDDHLYIGYRFSLSLKGPISLGAHLRDATHYWRLRSSVPKTRQRSAERHDSPTD
jgi:hypothetical protein